MGLLCQATIGRSKSSPPVQGRVRVTPRIGTPTSTATKFRTGELGEIEVKGT